jgi:hypothetical protein
VSLEEAGVGVPDIRCIISGEFARGRFTASNLRVLEGDDDRGEAPNLLVASGLNNRSSPAAGDIDPFFGEASPGNGRGSGLPSR